MYSLPMAIEMPVTEARERFSELVETSAHEPVFLTKRGHRQAVVISTAEYERLLEASEDSEDLASSDAMMAEIMAGGQGGPRPRMTYTIEISSSAAKGLSQLRKANRLRIVGAIELLSLDPRPPGAKMLRGGEHGRWRVRVGDYRIVYAIENDRLLVLVLRVAHRREV